MKYSEFKKAIESIEKAKFVLPNGDKVPAHYHLTEVGESRRRYIDCGGTIREEQYVTLQLWYTIDYDHDLSATKMLDILALSEERLGIGDHEIEVDYQMDTIGRYGLHFDGDVFHLVAKQTACLAPDKCNIPTQVDLTQMIATESCCTPGGGCC